MRVAQANGAFCVSVFLSVWLTASNHQCNYGQSPPILHQDIKSSNYLVTKGGNPIGTSMEIRLCDLGSAMEQILASSTPKSSDSADPDLYHSSENRGSLLTGSLDPTSGIIFQRESASGSSHGSFASSCSTLIDIEDVGSVTPNWAAPEVSRHSDPFTPWCLILLCMNLGHEVGSS